MKPLKEVLIDYDLAQLQSLAYKRGLEPPIALNREHLQTFVNDLLSPASVAIAVADLSATEKEALTVLVSAGGFIEARKFARAYGNIRSMGSNKLLREKPWESPQNSAEGLWYRGLIFKGFHHTINGPEEVVFIPHDLQTVLPVEPDAPPTFQVSLAPLPIHHYQANYLLREDLFALLVCFQTNIVQTSQNGELTETQQREITELFIGPGQLIEDEKYKHKLTYWFDFIYYLARQLNFLHLQGRRLKLNSTIVKTWLHQSLEEQLCDLQACWRNSSTWNDLWYVPGLFPKKTGWENNPMLGRAKILGYLAQLPPDEWIEITTFIQAIKQTEPDFQRPGGDYQTWYIYDANGNALMGFEHWQDVEGNFIQHLIVTVLYVLGVVELGAAGAGLFPTTFKITPLGKTFFNPETKKPPPPVISKSLSKINPHNFTIRVPLAASLYDRFQLARFAEIWQRDEKRVVYQITRESYRRAIEQSITLEQILAFLNRATGSHMPLALVETIRNWDRRTGAVKLEQLTVLRVNQKEIINELLEHPDIGPLLSLPLGPEAILVPEKHVTQVRKLLQEAGYLPL